ncbi:SHOCT domain-containing protein [Rhodoblastus acidophilus]|uniref:SHOCT domain-containing protein n=1 Tax=Candidatus Rhodoblastus alkanivorans TaxID=2954117 RepID=A0ABS9Z5Q4_9HYPH|nr:SHOCT domain-containing protein [Candidatus Rhodoblastus alkanivorans]MCI4679887.1 SHOCT domain-containing protein [Candidatus Rhodoblastus alkanivorans]MCI4682710.1 SHOCT domain-containing protein [Candidatus Rhodoblastus alkanivorans]MDI4640017.1 SHOCT domain-containing protein [Rhodoblastus acidophilus]
MQELTSEGRQTLQNLANAHGVSFDAALVLMQALVAGNGTQAQFSHPDLGGMGQWSRGGMIMIGDMFNNSLKYKVSQLCDELSGLLRHQSFFAPAPSQSQMQSQGGGAGVSFFVQGSSGSWWPAELGSPSSSGAQNDLRYAYFPGTRRLAIQQGGVTRIYDTGDHMIGGVSQQQSGDQSLTFTSQYGPVRVADLPLVSPAPQPAPAPQAPAAPAPEPEPAAFAPSPVPPAPAPAAPSTASDQDIFATIEKLAGLRDKGILSEEEFAKKKAELLSRL